MDFYNLQVVTLQVHYVRPTPDDDVTTFENILTEECRIQTNLPEDLIKNAQPLEHILDEVLTATHEYELIWHNIFRDRLHASVVLHRL